MRLSTRIGVGCGVAALLAGVLPGYAGMQHDRLVSDNPVDWTPIVEEDGRGVFGTATVGGTTVAVGEFSSVRERGAASPVTRNNIFAFDSSGSISDTFVPGIADRVFDVIPAGDGQSVYVGGSFRRVDGLRRTSRVARIDVDTGQVMTTFRSPGFDSKVTDLHLANGRLYVGGYFKNVRGVPHTGLVALDPQTGANTGSLDLTFADEFRGNSGTPRPMSGYNGVGVEQFTMTPDGSKLLAIGNFRTVDGQSRVQAAMVDTGGATATLSDWSTNRFSMTCSANFPTYTLDVDASPDGEYFVVVTGGAFNGGVTSGTLCDTVSRWEFDGTGSGQQPTWVDYMGGDSTTAVHITGPTIYIGGHFRWTNNPYAGDRVGPGAVHRRGLAALDPRNGLPFGWNPRKLPGNWGVLGFNTTAEGLWVGHDGDRVGGETTGALALMPLAGGASMPADNTGSLPGNAFLLGRTDTAAPPDTDDNDDVLRIGLTETGSTGSTETGNGGVDWSSARGAFMVDGRLYTGWADGTFTWRSFNGGNWFGGARQVDLNGLTAFSAELPAVQGMWFDRTTGRMYYTLAGQTGLYYRYFTPESRTVGAVRFTAVDTGSGIDWSRVTGGFPANGRLYFRNADGSLQSVQWQGGPVAGTVSNVSGPAVDGIDWSARALFLDAS
ncbi:MAG: hypothetical protein ACRDOJ_02770 [Nocardioidaceae bacterium]